MNRAKRRINKGSSRLASLDFGKGSFISGDSILDQYIVTELDGQRLSEARWKSRFGLSKSMMARNRGLSDSFNGAEKLRTLCGVASFLHPAEMRSEFALGPVQMGQVKLDIRDFDQSISHGILALP